MSKNYRIIASQHFESNHDKIALTSNAVVNANPKYKEP